MNETELHRIAQKIALEVFLAWEDREIKGTSAAVPHLAAALTTLARCGIRPRNKPFAEWIMRRAFTVVPARRRAAQRAIAQVGAPSPRAVCVLFRRLRSPQWQTRCAVLETLRELQIGSKQGEIFLLAAKELESPRMPVRVAAARLLIFWEQTEGSELMRSRMAWRPKGKKQSQYLLDLARDIAEAQEAKDTADLPVLTLDQGMKPTERTARQQEEIERLIALLASPRLEQRQKAARALGERMQTGAWVLQRDAAASARHSSMHEKK